MLNCSQFYQVLRRQGIDFFAGVPDSLLKEICAYITDIMPPQKNIIAANEGNAVALAAGYHLATGKIGLVYLQNSGLGNGINPLTSLTDSEAYSIPLIILIGWRGGPGKKDESQHKKMGRIMLDVLRSIELPYNILPKTIPDAVSVVDEAMAYVKTHSKPYAIVVEEGTFEAYKSQQKTQTLFQLNRELAIKTIMHSLDADNIVVSTTGKISRELFELRNEFGQSHGNDFLTIGSMGHASSIALGIALQKPQRDVYCFDGDGAVIMHMGVLAVIGKLQPANFKHIVFNNFTHDSVGGQPTAADAIHFPSLALASGYKTAFSAETEEDIRSLVDKIKTRAGPLLLEIRCNKGARESLGRPTKTPIENKLEFMGGLIK